MDIDRRRTEAAEYNRKPRLIEFNELPPAIIIVVKRLAEESAEEAAAAANPIPQIPQPIDLGRRRRKEVDYSQVYLNLRS
jgi:hypothetical protein